MKVILSKIKSISITVLFSLMVGFLSVYFINLSGSDIFLSYFLIMTIFLITFLVVISFIKKRKKFDIFGIIYWSLGYFLLIFGVRAIYIFIFGSPFFGKLPFKSETFFAFNLALFYIILALIVFLIGYYSKFGAALANVLPSLPKTWSKNKAKFIIPSLFIIGALFYFILIQRLGGFKYYVLNKELMTRSGISGNHYWALGAGLLQYAFFVALLFWLKNKNFAILTWGILFPINLIIVFLSGSKGSFLGFLFPTLIMFNYLRKKIRIKHIIIFTICAFLIFPIFNIYRGNFKNISELLIHSKNRIEIIKKDIGSLIPETLHRFTSLDALVVAIRDTPKAIDFQLGKTLTTVFVAPIPRKMWEEKPIISFGKKFSVIYLGFTGPVIEAGAEAIGPLGEGYINFHLAGILLAAFLIGILSRLIYHYCIYKSFGDSGIFCYAFLLTSLFRIWEWNIPGWITGFLPLLFTIVIISLLLEKKNPKFIGNIGS